ncbi:MAG TPA: hypothetical protein DEQ54_03370, partial [Firmicutes bacterium]|nr:hypothetical protein [Bacillota bacterium]
SKARYTGDRKVHWARRSKICVQEIAGPAIQETVRFAYKKHQGSLCEAQQGSLYKARQDPLSYMRIACRMV